MWAREAAERVLQYKELETLLDVGSGVGAHASLFRSNGFEVTTLDSNPDYNADICMPFVELTPDDSRRFDVVWASHVLEHQENVGLFLVRCRRHLSERGILAITVPPAKHNIVGGHLTIWNQGLLVYNLVRAGFDCSRARVSTLYDNYNLSVIVENKARPTIPLLHDAGDIEKLAPYFPFPVHQDFDGSKVEANW